MVTLNDMLNLINDSKLIEIKTAEKTIFKGYKGNMQHCKEIAAAGARIVEEFKVIPEISRRDKPSTELLPVTELNAGQFNFADLRVWLRYTYILKSE